MQTKPRRKWKARELALLGRFTDVEVARRIGVSRKHVVETRQRHGIAAAPRKRK